MSCKHVRAHFIASVRVYDLCARICAQIFMKFETWAHKIVIDHHMKFHEDLSFGCGDICKTNLRLFNPSFSLYFSYFHNLSTKVPPKFEKYNRSQLKISFVQLSHTLFVNLSIIVLDIFFFSAFVLGEVFLAWKAFIWVLDWVCMSELLSNIKEF